ncbi:hypothetical protein Cs7R123_33710 [Catellatospora sp. TT07R-123]|uniref:hypothetical protein n=1 Tax=Catellatospora sp. TT07R-123 TaxID=2733863 RepID=UPI001B265A23|nr:hypothetical protein [Catellatospora sp. TT07R-123]GHJ46029.1 hypothetical protein Cs7R123_33710 [Catellatospora sp. TT07R-123]
MRAFVRTLLGTVSALLAVGLFGTAAAAVVSPSGDRAKAELWTAMGTQWSDSARYTREYYVAALLGGAHPGAAQAAAASLMKNQKDIGAVFAKYYGTGTGDQISDILSQQVAIAADLVPAAGAGDKAKLADATARWQQSHAELAKVLSTANPDHFPYEQTRQLLDRNLALLTTAVTSFAGGDYAQSIAGNEAYYQDVQNLVGYFGNGIVAEFPEQFK